MPIAFPLPKRGPAWIQAENLVAGAALAYCAAGKQYVPNLLRTDDLAAPITANNFGGEVLGPQRKAVNLRRLGTVYQDPTLTSTPVIVPLRYPVLAKQQGFLVWRLAGVSRDSSGAPLGGCTVKIFETASDTKVAETVSDASGAWSVEMLRQGPFYFVEYLVGAPDRAGTSINTNVPVLVS